MKIIIDIDDCTYTEIKEDTEKFRSKGMVVPYLYKVIESGTPLPKGHGDLIDRNDLLKQPIDVANYPSNYVRVALTIIPAEDAKVV